MCKSIDRATARQVIANLETIARAGNLAELCDALEYARRQWRDERNHRTIGESLRWQELAEFAARQLGIDRELCQEAAADVAGWPQVAVAVIRTEAERVSFRPAGQSRPQRRRRGVA